MTAPYTYSSPSGGSSYSSGYVPFDLPKKLLAKPNMTPAEFAEWAKEQSASRETDFEKRIHELAEEHREQLWQLMSTELTMALAREAASPAGGGKKLNATYNMEKIDPKHRAVWLLESCLKEYERLKPVKGFFKWLDEMPEFERATLLRDRSNDDKSINKSSNLSPSDVKQFLTGVSYLDDGARPSYGVELRAGLMWLNGQQLDTAMMRTVFSGPGWAIFVQSPASGQFYTNSHKLGMFHHSSFLSGAPVLSAGEWKVTAGRPEIITPKSGHYQPGADELALAVTTLNNAGVDLSQTKVRLYKGGAPVLVDARAFINDPNRKQYTAWGKN